jgi:hypothetical protein
VRTRRLILALLAGATLVAPLGALSACSSSGASTVPDQVPSPSGSPSAAPLSAFGRATSAKYQLSVLYPLHWVSAVRAAKAGDKVVTTLLSMTWADPKGAIVGGGSFVDTLHVAVYEMSRKVGPNDLKVHRAAFVAIAASMLKGLPGLRITDPIAPITLNGTPGLQVTYTYTVQGTHVGAMSYLLPKGSYAYWVTGQSSESTWTSAWSKLAPAMASFTIGPVKS